MWGFVNCFIASLFGSNQLASHEKSLNTKSNSETFLNHIISVNLLETSRSHILFERIYFLKLYRLWNLILFWTIELRDKFIIVSYRYIHIFNIVSLFKITHSLCLKNRFSYTHNFISVHFDIHAYMYCICVVVD